MGLNIKKILDEIELHEYVERKTICVRGKCKFCKDGKTCKKYNKPIDEIKQEECNTPTTG